MGNLGGACFSLPVLAVLATVGCGYVGGPQLPLANVPEKITDLAAVQRGDTIIVHFTVPTHTTESVAIRPPVKLDLRIGTASENFNTDEWATHAKAVSSPQLKDGIATYRVPAAEWTGKEVVIGARAIGSNGKQAGWSNYAAVPVVARPEIPSALAFTNTPAGIQVSWTGRGDHFRLLRRNTGDQNLSAVANTVDGHEWTDSAVENGKSYDYQVQALVDLGNQKVAESELSEIKSQTYEDKFPPAAPTGLQADPTPNSVALVWESNTEPDLAGYRVYRSVGDRPFEKVADVNAVPSYSDNMIEHGKTYHYAVTAIDKANNESNRSAPVEIVP